MHNDKNSIATFLKKALGITLIVIGVIGLFVPILQGIALIAAGALLLNNSYVAKKIAQLRAWLTRNNNSK